MVFFKFRFIDELTIEQEISNFKKKFCFVFIKLIFSSFVIISQRSLQPSFDTNIYQKMACSKQLLRNILLPETFLPPVLKHLSIRIEKGSNNKIWTF